MAGRPLPRAPGCDEPRGTPHNHAAQNHQETPRPRQEPHGLDTEQVSSQPSVSKPPDQEPDPQAAEGDERPGAALEDPLGDEGAGDVPCAVETQRQLGSRLRNHL